jgi:hypothetical protein
VSKRFGLAVAAIAWAALAGCAKNPTTIVVPLGTDATAPPILILGANVVSAADPTRTGSSLQASPESSDAGDRPGPFPFPFYLTVTVDASLAGPVNVTIEGIDWDSYAVIATGSTTATVVAEQAVYSATAVVLTATGAPGGDGGPDATGD